LRDIYQFYLNSYSCFLATFSQCGTGTPCAKHDISPWFLILSSPVVNSSTDSSARGSVIADSVWNDPLRCAVRATSSMSVIGRIGSSKFNYKNLLGYGSGSGWSVLSRIRFWIEYYQFFQILGHFGLSFEFLWTQVTSNFMSFRSGSDRVLGHLISGSFRFRVTSDRIRSDRIIFCHVLFRVWLDFISLDFKLFPQKYIWANILVNIRSSFFKKVISLNLVKSVSYRHT
jgi:hypothetical protein